MMIVSKILAPGEEFFKKVLKSKSFFIIGDQD